MQKLTALRVVPKNQNRSVGVDGNRFLINGLYRGKKCMFLTNENIKTPLLLLWGFPKIGDPNIVPFLNSRILL